MANTSFIMVLGIILMILRTTSGQDKTITLNLKSNPIVSYNKVIEELRDYVKGSVAYQGVPMMQPPSSPPKYAVVNIEAKRGDKDITISVAINKTNLYVVGYAEGNRIAYFFADEEHAKKMLFLGVSQKGTFMFRTVYSSIEVAAGTQREGLKMSLEDLSFSAFSVYGIKDLKKKSFAKDQAKFVLHIIQALSEGARFKYIQHKYGSGTGTTVPDYKAPKMENEWEKISRAFKKSKDTKKKIDPPLMLKYPDNSDWKVTSVVELQEDMGILLYVV